MNSKFHGVTRLLLALFWACFAGGLVQILAKVCKGYRNQKRLRCRLRNKTTEIVGNH